MDPELMAEMWDNRDKTLFRFDLRMDFSKYVPVEAHSKEDAIKIVSKWAEGIADNAELIITEITVVE